MIDGVTEDVMRAIGNGNKDWNTKNPSWNIVRQHIRADVSLDLPGAMATLKPQLLQANHEAIKDIVSKVGQPDVDVITAFYHSSAGKRYQDFDHKISALLQSGETSFASGQKTSNTSTAKPTKEQLDRFGKLAQLSKTIQLQMGTLSRRKKAFLNFYRQSSQTFCSVYSGVIFWRDQ